VSLVVVEAIEVVVLRIVVIHQEIVIMILENPITNEIETAAQVEEAVLEAVLEEDAIIVVSLATFLVNVRIKRVAVVEIVVDDPAVIPVVLAAAITVAKMVTFLVNVLRADLEVDEINVDLREILEAAKAEVVAGVITVVKKDTFLENVLMDPEEVEEIDRVGVEIEEEARGVLLVEIPVISLEIAQLLLRGRF